MSAGTSPLVSGLMLSVARICLLAPLIAGSTAPACAQEAAQTRAAAARAARIAQLANCFEVSSKRWGVDVVLLQAIARVESDFYPRAIHVNTDESVDFGVMQVNSWHLPRLNQQGITSAKLLDDPCLNIDIGASILADTLRQFGATWRSVGAYGAGNAKSASKEKARVLYAGKVYGVLVGVDARSTAQKTSVSTARARRSTTVAQMQVLE